jgi:hypothetical protein
MGLTSEKVYSNIPLEFFVINRSEIMPFEFFEPVKI